jgi:DNA segregation ATPase FtsK/SpoIIIE, S-DNA-T family
MANPPPTTSSKSRDSDTTTAKNKLPLLDSRRLSELCGFLLGVAGLLVLLSLLSFQPEDPSLNTIKASGTVPQNLIGPVGAYLADGLFQTFGWVAYLLPLSFLVIGIRHLLDRPFNFPRTKAAGLILFGGSLAALLELFPYTPAIKGFIHGSGLAGYLLAAGLVHVLNRLGGTIVATTAFLASLFLITRFSFSATAEFLKHHFGFLQTWQARWNSWREARQKNRLRREVERTRVVGKPPVITQRARPAADEPVKEAAKPVVAPPGTTAGSMPPAAGVSPGKLTEAAPIYVSAREGSSPSSAPRIIGTGPRRYKLPSASLLRPPEDAQSIDESELRERAQRLTEKLAEFGVTGTVTQIHPGPVVTTYEFKPEAGIKYSRITNLVDDLCLAMKAESILIERIPGKSTVGIEVPNLHREIIHLREAIESSEFGSAGAKLTLCLGKDIRGKMKVGDLVQMPHLLIAGSTGSGKSVAINSMIVSILYKATPDEVKLILIDPKRLELNLYEDVPHLLTPIVTEPKQAANALRRAVMEMEERLKKLAEHGVRSIEQYNKVLEPDSTLNLFDTNGNQEAPLPYIVIVIDELADLMMVEPQGVEESVTRLAQMARAVGIHLILATQRPSVDVITGLIKANLPSRISFRVASKVDSRTILDTNGSEALLGRGDMLFLPPGSARLVRLHGPLVTEQEINRVVEWWKGQSQPRYNEEFLKPIRDKNGNEGPDEEDEDNSALDAVYEDAVRIVVESGKASTSLLQRRLRLGYGRAARLIDMMEKDGIVSAPDGARPREVLKKPDWLHEVDESPR